MAKEGKKPIFKRWWFWVIIVVVILAIAAGSGSGSDGNTSTGSSTSSSTDSAEQSDNTAADSSEQESQQSQEKYAVEEGEVDTSNPYMWQISGTVTNNSGRDLSYIQVEYVLYDSDGAQIGNAYDNANNLKAGGVWKYNAAGTVAPDEVASYELTDITAY